MADNPNTHDPEYNSEAIHSGDTDPWFTNEEPADETYHPYTEDILHEYEPQDRPNVPAYTPKVNTGGSYPPDAHYPETEKDLLHIVTYGTVEDVAFAENGDDEEDPDSRREGLVSMSIRDEMDDLIHTDFHTLNPLSLLSEQNVRVGDRVRVDIQDYKNVIEWFVYNYPWLLKCADLLKVGPADGPWFTGDDGLTYKGGDILRDPDRFDPRRGGSLGEDWEHQVPGSLLDTSYLEIGQKDGNKKITIRQFLELIDHYFQISDIWKTLRDHEKRIVDLEKDARKEDVDRGKRIDKEITRSYYNPLPHTSWDDSSDLGAPSRFTGNTENGSFSLHLAYQSNQDLTKNPGTGFDIWGTGGEDKLGKRAMRILNAGTIPTEFIPTTFHWIHNYGIILQRVGGWEDLIMGIQAVDIGFDTDGSVWIDVTELDQAYAQPQPSFGLGIFGPGGFADHRRMLPEKGGWSWLVQIFSFGGVIYIGDTDAETMGTDDVEKW